jgi:plasmid maintenance system antidote protein VapI
MEAHIGGLSMCQNFVLKSQIVKWFGSQKAASAALGIDQARLSNLLRGRGVPSTHEAVRLANFFGAKFVIELRRHALATAELEATLNAQQ